MKTILTTALLLFSLVGFGQSKHHKSQFKHNDHFYFISWYTKNASFGNSTVALPIEPNNLDLKIYLESSNIDTNGLVIMSVNRITESQFKGFFIKRRHIIKIENNIIYANDNP